MNYANDRIRTVLLAGHAGSGKTSLAEAMLYLTKGTDRLGRVEDGNTVCDYDPEEARRRSSLSLALAPVGRGGSTERKSVGRRPTRWMRSLSRRGGCPATR